MRINLRTSTRSQVLFAHPAPSEQSLGFLLKTYPKLSETFILEEVLGLERQGLKLHIFSLQAPSDEVEHPIVQKVKAPVTYIPPLGSRQLSKLLAAQFDLLLRSPLRYGKALAFALQRTESGRIRDFLHAGWLASRLNTLGIQHLHAHFINRPAGIAELVERLSGQSYSISAHAKDIYLSEPSVLRRKIARARFTVTCTEYNRLFLSAIAGLTKPIFRQYHGIDASRFTAPAQRTHSKPPMLLSVGRLREKKGFATLISACAQLKQAGLAVHCNIVGYGPERERLQQQINAAGLQGHVKLLGKLTQDQVIDLYRQASAFVLPCQVGKDGDRDGIPNVLLEAMAMRLPVISTTVSGIPEVIQHEHNGLLLDPQDPAALAIAINRVLSDQPLAQRLGHAARQTITQQFNNGINLQKLQQLLANNAGQPGALGTLLEEQLYG